MGRKNQQQALLSGPPAELLKSQQVGKVDTINGNNIYTVTLPESSPTSDKLHLVELPPKFRNSMWIRRGGFVLVDVGAFEGRENKLSGEIVTVIHDEKSWRRMDYWPREFSKLQEEQDSASNANKVRLASGRHAEDQDNFSDDSLSGQGNPNRRPRYDSEEE